jgi:hypothetical protein
MSHEQLFHECKSARVLCRSIRLLNLTKSIFWTSLEALSSSWLYVHHQRRREVLLSSDKRVRIAYLLECCAGLFRPWSRAGAGCKEAQAGVSFSMRDCAASLDAAMALVRESGGCWYARRTESQIRSCKIYCRSALGEEAWLGSIRPGRGTDSIQLEANQAGDRTVG